METQDRSLTRRDFVGTASVAALGSALALNQPAFAQAATAGSDFDINEAFAGFMRDLGGSPSDGGGIVTFIGRDPILRSHFRIASSMALPAMAAGVGAAAIWRERTGQGQDVNVDLRESIYNVMPVLALVLQQKQAAGVIPASDPIPKSVTFVPTINGLWPHGLRGLANPMSFGIFETKDGRHVTITGIYPHLYERALNVLRASPNRESIVTAIKQWDAADLDDALSEARGVGGVHRTAEEWVQHPEGRYLAGTPLIDIRKIGEAAPIPYSPDPTQPLSGLKVLALTHVIAGSTAARTMAEYGAEVLQVARYQAFEHEMIWTDVNVGMRSAFMDLRDPEQNKVLAGLVPEANVFMESFSGRAIERLGFGVEEVAKQRPGIVYLTVRCYGWDGPWRDRAGFDMEGLTVSGFTMAEGGGKSPEFSQSYALAEGDPRMPAFPPTMVLNDYVAGYIGAAGVLAALRRQAKERGSYHVRVNLTRAAMWYQSLGAFPTTDFDATDPEHRIIEPETVSGMTPFGEVHRLAPQVKLSKTPGRWRDPLVIVRGSGRPVWKAA